MSRKETGLIWGKGIDLEVEGVNKTWDYSRKKGIQMVMDLSMLR